MSMPEKYISFRNKTAETLNVDPEILDNVRLSDLKEYDSMGVIELALVVEEQFCWEIPLEALDNVGLLRELFDYIEANRPNELRK